MECYGTGINTGLFLFMKKIIDKSDTRVYYTIKKRHACRKKDGGGYVID